MSTGQHIRSRDLSRIHKPIQITGEHKRPLSWAMSHHCTTPLFTYLEILMTVDQTYLFCTNIQRIKGRSVWYITHIHTIPIHTLYSYYVRLLHKTVHLISLLEARLCIGTVDGTDPSNERAVAGFTRTFGCHTLDLRTMFPTNTAGKSRNAYKAGARFDNKMEE